MTHKWLIRAYRDGDEEGIYELWRAVYPVDQTDRENWTQLWHWLYRENPAGNGLIWLAEANNRIVAQHALIPIKFKVGNQIILGSWGVDAMTHPDYRRLGLFENINKKLFTDANRIGIKLGTGIPNRYSRPGIIKKSGWIDVGQMTCMIKPNNWKNTTRFKIRNPLLSNIASVVARVLLENVIFRPHELPLTDHIAVTQISSFDKQFDRLWFKISHRYEIIAVHDNEYLNWRYRPPNKVYDIFTAQVDNDLRGFLISRNKIQKGIVTTLIFSLFGESEEIMHHLVSTAVKSSRQAGADYIIYSFIAGSEYHQAVKKCGFIPVPFLKERNFCVYSNDPQISMELQNPKNWLFQTGDTDTF